MNKNHGGWITRFLVTITITILLASCGQKGDLYLPEDQQSALYHSHIHS
jgi:predicted small lipoprotein YifL